MGFQAIKLVLRNYISNKQGLRLGRSEDYLSSPLSETIFPINKD